jgi:Arc/MetJ family transcription regulator
MHMRITLNLDGSLVAEAMRLTGLKEKTAVIHAGLEALIRRESASRLAALGSSDPKARAPQRRRAPQFRRP